MMLDFKFFDPLETLSVVERKLPQWSQAGVLCFLTFRAHDSMPKAVVETFLQERNDWLIKLIKLGPSTAGILGDEDMG